MAFLTRCLSRRSKTAAVLLVVLVMLQAANAATVRGRLVRPANDGLHPAAGVAVTLNSQTIGRSSPAHSGPDGMYQLNGIPPGVYYLEVWTSRDPRVPPIVQQVQIGEPYSDIPPITVPPLSAAGVGQGVQQAPPPGNAAPWTPQAQQARPPGNATAYTPQVQPSSPPAGAAVGQGPQQAPATGGATALTPQDQQAIVAAHNAYRSDPAINAPPLRWSNDLAAGAQSWATHLAATGVLEHRDTQGDMNAPGENLAESSAGSLTPAQMVDIWGNAVLPGKRSEKSNFQPGTFPNISKTGNWEDAGHYSQVIWRTTTSVGCGFASNGTNDYLVCRYGPAGNVETFTVP